jgi:hypothetical protein
MVSTKAKGPKPLVALVWVNSFWPYRWALRLFLPIPPPDGPVYACSSWPDDENVQRGASARSHQPWKIVMNANGAARLSHAAPLMP